MNITDERPLTRREWLLWALAVGALVFGGYQWGRRAELERVNAKLVEIVEGKEFILAPSKVLESF